MKKNTMGKRVVAFMTAMIVTVISPLSYGGFPFSGLFVNAQEAMNYISNVKVQAGDNEEVIVAWEYMDDSVYSDLADGSYGVSVSKGQGEPQLIGEISVSKRELVTEEPEEESGDEESGEEEEPEEEEELVYEIVVEKKNSTKQAIFQGQKKIDAEYRVFFVKYDENGQVIQEIETVSGLEYKAVCTIQLEVKGQGHVDFMGKPYYTGRSEAVSFSKYDRFIHIIPEGAEWRFDEATFQIEGAEAVKSAEGISKYDISKVTGDIVIVVTFIEKLTTPKQESSVSTDENDPTVFTEPFTFLIKEQEGVTYKYTVDGKEPKNNSEAKTYTAQGIYIEDYSHKFAIKMYAEEEGKDASDVVSWYGKIVPKEPVITGGADFLEENKIVNTTYLKTDKGDVLFLVEHEVVAKEKYELCLGIAKGEAIQWESSSDYREGKYQFLIPSDLSTGTYEFFLRYKTKGGNYSERSSIKKEIKIDNTKPTVKAETFMVLENGQRQMVTSPAWVGKEVEFSLSGEAFSGIQSYEISTDGENFTKLEIKNGTYSLPIEEIAQGDSSYYFRSRSFVNHISGATKEFVLKKDTTPPEGLSVENLVIETISDSKEDVGNAIYSDNNIAITLKEIKEKEDGTDSKLTLQYRFDTMTENSVTAKGSTKGWKEGPIILDKMGKYEFCIWYRDEAGNNSKEYKQILCYDNQDAAICSEPRFKLIGDRKEAGFPDYKFFAKNELSLQFSAKDEHSGLSRIVIKNGDSVIREQKLNGSTEEMKFEIGVSEEGKYNLSVDLYDKAGRKISLSSEVGGFIIDRSGPELQINSSKAEQEWQKEDINFTMNATDNGSGIGKAIITVNGKAMEQAVNAYQESLSMQVTANEEAENSEGYLLKVEAFNNAGETQTMDRKVFLDKTAPIITIGGIEPTSVNQKVPNLSIKVVEKIYNLAEVTLSATRSIDGGTSSYNLGGFIGTATETTNQYEFPEDGIYEVLVEAKDKAGNQAEKQKIDFSVDTTAPEIEISGPKEASFHAEEVSVLVKVTESFYDTNTVTIKASKTIDGTTIPYEVGNFANTGKVSTMTHRFLEDGTYHIEVSAKDKAGNSSQIKELTFSVDKTAPEVSIEGIENYHVTDQETTLTVSVTESFFAGNEVSIHVKKEDVAGKTTAFPIAPFYAGGTVSRMSYQFKEEGIYSIMVKATDEAGNTAETEKILTIDTSYPVINHMEQFDGQYLQYFALEYSLEEMIQDFTISDYRMTLNGDLYNGEKIVVEGKYLFLVEVTDEVNHKSEAKAEFIIDNTVPEIIIIGAQDEQKVYEPIEISIRLNEADDKLTTVSINGELQSLNEDGKTFETILDKMDTYQVEVLSEDLAKNKSSKFITVKYMEKPLYVKIYENKPVFYGTIAAGGTAIAGGGIALTTMTGKGFLKKLLLKLLRK